MVITIRLYILKYDVIIENIYFFLSLLLSQVCDYKSVNKIFNPQKVKTNIKLENIPN